MVELYVARETQAVLACLRNSDESIADGLCAIDVVHSPGASDGGARISDFRAAALDVLVNCVSDNYSVNGGYVNHIGRSILLIS